MPIENLQPAPARKDQARHPGSRWIDVRTPEEFDAGHPDGAVNVPWALRDPAGGRMVHNPDFLPTVQKHFGKDARLYLSCQAGVRSLNACKELETAGYSHLVNVDGGFGGRRDPMGAVLVKGWVDCGLPVANDRSTYETLRKG